MPATPTCAATHSRSATSVPHGFRGRTVRSSGGRRRRHRRRTRLSWTLKSRQRCRWSNLQHHMRCWPCLRASPVCAPSRLPTARVPPTADFRERFGCGASRARSQERDKSPGLSIYKSEGDPRMSILRIVTAVAMTTAISALIAPSAGALNYCGGKYCDPGEVCCGAFCKSKVECFCKAPKSTCGTSCVDKHVNPKHCGSCGVSCQGRCANGACTPVTVQVTRPKLAALDL